LGYKDARERVKRSAIPNEEGTKVTCGKETKEEKMSQRQCAIELGGRTCHRCPSKAKMLEGGHDEGKRNPAEKEAYLSGGCREKRFQTRTGIRQPEFNGEG